LVEGKTTDDKRMRDLADWTWTCRAVWERDAAAAQQLLADSKQPHLLTNLTRRAVQREPRGSLDREKAQTTCTNHFQVVI
jgi:hypothetical protein